MHFDSIADNKLARINDSDGFTNIRSGEGKDFPIVATIDTTDFIYCDPTTKNDWVKETQKYNKIPKKIPTKN